MSWVDDGGVGSLYAAEKDGGFYDAAALDRGLAGSYAARALTMGAERLLYNLYLDAARTIVWGDGTGGSRAGPGVITRGAHGTTAACVFGRIPAGQDVLAGVYGDTIRVSFEL